MIKHYYRTLTIAGSDSGGGAGIQADLKTFAALGCYGMSAITALTAQNTCEVNSIYPVSAEFIKAQIEMVINDIGVDAIKIGMLKNVDNIKIVAEALSALSDTPIVIDPVRVATSGEVLLEINSTDEIKKSLFPIATLLTPNLNEAEFLLNQKIKTRDAMVDAAKQLCDFGLKAVLIKGGHLQEKISPDCLYIKEHDELIWFETKRLETKNTHGTGCTLSSAITAFLAQKVDLALAVKKAKEYVFAAIQSGAEYQIGHGHGPVNHFYRWWGE